MSGAGPFPVPTSLGSHPRPGWKRPLTVPAMRAAVIALRAGLFDCFDVAEAVDDGLHAAASRTQGLQAVGARTPWTDIEGPVVVVLAGHAGAGASAMALAI